MPPIAAGADGAQRPLPRVPLQGPRAGTAGRLHRCAAGRPGSAGRARPRERHAGRHRRRVRHRQAVRGRRARPPRSPDAEALRAPSRCAGRGLRRRLGDVLSFRVPNGGMALWVRVADGIDILRWEQAGEDARRAVPRRRDVRLRRPRCCRSSASASPTTTRTSWPRPHPGWRAPSPTRGRCHGPTERTGPVARKARPHSRDRFHLPAAREHRVAASAPSRRPGWSPLGTRCGSSSSSSSRCSPGRAHRPPMLALHPPVPRRPGPRSGPSWSASTRP